MENQRLHRFHLVVISDSSVCVRLSVKYNQILPNISIKYLPSFSFSPAFSSFAASSSSSFAASSSSLSLLLLLLLLLLSSFSSSPSSPSSSYSSRTRDSILARTPSESKIIVTEAKVPLQTTTTTSATSTTPAKDNNTTNTVLLPRLRIAVL